MGVASKSACSVVPRARLLPRVKAAALPKRPVIDRDIVTRSVVVHAETRYPADDMNVGMGAARRMLVCDRDPHSAGLLPRYA